MSFESCFGGFAGSKSAPAAMGGKGSFAPVPVNGGNAPIAVVHEGINGTAGFDPHRTFSARERANSDGRTQGVVDRFTR
jgi:hypothetical protein